jgi:hypothetical protein
VADDDRISQTGAYLRMLLCRPGDYRSRWEQAGAGPSLAGRIDNAAVVAVLDGAPDHAVHQALSGTALSADLLERFISRFRFSVRHASLLRDVWGGSSSTKVITGDAVSALDLAEQVAPAGYQTLALHEIHTLGPDGLPAEHQTTQVIRSTVDLLESFPYRFDTDRLTVAVTRGGHVGHRIYRVSEVLNAVDILLDRPLPLGESTLMQFHSTFFYDVPPPAEFRRGLARTTTDVSMWVRFHPARLPHRVWWARWDRLDQARVITQEPVDLDDMWSVNRRVDQVERAIVGFYWEWD